jgi:serine/threonine-protein phosphatase 5
MSKDMVEEQSHEDSKWFDIWSEIEKREEADLVKSSSETKSEDVRERVMTRDLSGGKLSRQSSLRSRQSSLEQHVMAMLLDSHSTRLVQDPSYLGPHLSEPLTLESVAQLIKYFSKMDDVFEQSPFIGGVRQNTKHKVPLHRLYVLDLLKKTKDILVKLPNVVNVEFSKPSDYPAGFSGEPEVTVVGDLHGQLGDLLHIFEKQGLPSAVNQYVFNGDWVDRGHWGAEIVLILFALKVLYPNYVHLNRGNHEAREIASRDGFEKEVTIKWDYDIFECFIDVFATLPLAAIIDKKVFVVHAGLSWENFTIEDLSSCDRFAENPPAASLMEDILWSDPINKRGRYVNDRG